MSSSNAASGIGMLGLHAPPVVLPEGFLAPPTWEMLVGVAETPEQIVDHAVRVSEAYLYHCIFTAYPSPKCPLPSQYADLLIGLPPASAEHSKRIVSSLNYIVKSESFFWRDSIQRFAPFMDILEEKTAKALCALCCHWDTSTVHTHLFLATHESLIKRELDVDPNPPQPIHENMYALQRSSSIGPPGTDLYLYQGSYLISIEKMLGYVGGTYNYETYETEGGEPGFVRDVGKHLLFPALQPRLERLIAGYQAHPVQCLAQPLQMLGVPRHEYVLSPLTLGAEEQCTEEDLAIAAQWKTFTTARYSPKPADHILNKTLHMLKQVKDSVAILKSDSAATLLMLKASAVASGIGTVLSPDVISYMSSFAGTRLADDARELQIRRRPACVSDAAMELRGALIAPAPKQRCAAAAAAAASAETNVVESEEDGEMPSAFGSNAAGGGGGV